MPEKTETLAAETRKISKAEINALPLIAWEGEIRVLDSVASMQAAVEELKNETHLGFDTETRPTFKKGEYYPPPEGRGPIKNLGLDGPRG